MFETMSLLASITGVILVGGRGTRLRPVLPDRPKVLARVLGRPFLTYLLEQLAQAGVGQVVLCTGYLGEQVRQEMGDKYGSLNLEYSWEEEPLGTGGAVRRALAHCASDPVLVMNGDSFIDADLASFYQWFTEKELPAALLLTWVPETSRYGRVMVGEAGLVAGFEEKGAHPGPGWINAGVYLLRRRVLLPFPEGQFFSLERDLLPRWMGKGLHGYPAGSNFIDIGTPESYFLAEQFFSRK